MANLEQEDIEIDVEEETPEEETPEEVEDGSEEITYEQALEWKKKAERLDKAEKALIERKKAEKQKKKEDAPINSKDEVKRIFAEEKFYDKNPDAEAYRKEIERYQDKGLSLEESYILASKSDKEVEERREVYGKSFVKWSWTSDWLSVISMDIFDRMTPQAQTEYTTKMTAKYWKIRFK